MTLAMVFPGQGSQSVGMQAELARQFEVVKTTYDEASEGLGYDLWRLVQDGPKEELNNTLVTQPAMLAAGVAAWRAWREAGGTMPSHMAGHSLGEYTALVCAGALTFSAAVLLVRRRSELMQEAVPVGEGAMAAILGLDADVVVDICEIASAVGIAEAVNFNSPGQVVVAGQKSAVSTLLELAKERGARRAIMLDVSVPAHSSLMRPAGEALAEDLAATDFSAAEITVLNSVGGQPYGGPDDIRERLQRQISSPVQWVKTVNALIASGVDALVECGPGKVLAGLCRRIDKSVAVICIDNPDNLSKALA